MDASSRSNVSGTNPIPPQTQNNLDTELEINWYEKNTVAKTAGAALIAIGAIAATVAASAGVALAVGLVIAGSPALMIAGVVALTITSVALGALGIYLVTRRPSFKDPEVRKKAIEQIHKNDMTYQSIHKAYGRDLLPLPVSINREFFSKCFEHKIRSERIYEDIINPYSLGLLRHLNEDLLLLMQDKFLAMVDRNKTLYDGIDGVKNKELLAISALWRNEMKCGALGLELPVTAKVKLATILVPQDYQNFKDGKITFETFLKRNTGLMTGFLSEEKKHQIGQRFADYLVESDRPFYTHSAEWKDSITDLKPYMGNFVNRIREKSLKMLREGKYNYPDFKSHTFSLPEQDNSHDNLEYYGEENKTLFKEKFLEMDWASMNDSYNEDRLFLGIQPLDIKNALARDAIQLNYFGKNGFKEKRGSDALSKFIAGLSTEESEVILKPLREKTLEQIADWSFQDMKKVKVDLDSLKITSEDIADLINCSLLTLTYPEFREKHGVEVLDVLNEKGKENATKKLLEAIPNLTRSQTSYILQDIERFGCGDVLRQKLEGDIEDCSIWVELFSKYPLEVFERKIISADNLKMRAIAKGEMLRLRNPSDFDLQFYVRHNLIPSDIHGIFQNWKEKLDEARKDLRTKTDLEDNEYERLKQAVNLKAKEDLTEWREARDFDKLKGDVELLNISRSLESINAIIRKNANKISITKIFLSNISSESRGISHDRNPASTIQMIPVGVSMREQRTLPVPKTDGLRERIGNLENVENRRWIMALRTKLRTLEKKKSDYVQKKEKILKMQSDYNELAKKYKNYKEKKDLETQVHLQKLDEEHQSAIKECKISFDRRFDELRDEYRIALQELS